MPSPPVLQSPLLSRLAGVRHAFFTRQGGVSTGIYDSLNVGLGSGDTPDAVLENRRRCAGHFGAEAIVTAYQIHSAIAQVAAGPWPDCHMLASDPVGEVLNTLTVASVLAS